MNRQIFEGRFLVNMAGSIIRQSTLRPMHGEIDWESIYRTAEYHKIANIIYLGLLGSDTKKGNRWRERFFESYQSALRYGEICLDSEREILVMLEMKGIPCTILDSCISRKLYQLRETAANTPLRLFVSPEDHTLAKGFLVDLGYETEVVYKDCGERMKRVSGHRVEIYSQFPVKLPSYQKRMLQILERARIKDPFHGVRIMSLEDEFVFRAAENVYHYVTDGLLIRELLDMYLFYKEWKEELREEVIWEGLKDFRIDDITQLLMQLTRMWFGAQEDPAFGTPSEEMNVYDAIENRILSRGKIKKENNIQVLYLENQLEQIIKKETKKEQWIRFKTELAEKGSSFMKGLRWLFPEYRYMCGLYPIVEKIPPLLPLCWIRRDIRLLLQLIKKK